MEAEKIPLENLLVVSDDIALPFGTLRLRPKGSAGGHNGLKNISELLGTEEYARMRFGVGGDFPGDIRWNTCSGSGTTRSGAGPARAAQSLRRRHPVVRNRRNGDDDELFQQEIEKAAFRPLFCHITPLGRCCFLVIAGPAKSLRCQDSAPPFRFARTCRIPLNKEPGRLPSFSLQILQEKDRVALLAGALPG